MAVYVDDTRNPYGRMIMCHMFADTLDELHAMADKIGIQRRWFQKPPKASWEHYDICISKKDAAIAAGAILTDRYGAAEFNAKQTGNQKMLDTIKFCREQRIKNAEPV